MLPLLADPPEGTADTAWVAACSTVRAYCGWHIAPTITETLTLDGPGGTLLRLPSAHVVTVTSVTNAGVQLADPEWSKNGYIRSAGWTERLRGVVVEFEHGYDACPPEVFEVLRQMSLSAAAIIGSGAGMAASVASGPFSLQFSAAAQAGAVGLSGQHRGILDRYRLAVRP